MTSSKFDKKDGFVARAAGPLRPQEMLGDRTNDASVTWGQSKQDALNNLAATGLAGPFHAVEVPKIIQKQGRVMPSPLRGNPNHCNLFGLLVKDFNNLFS
jgi:hypothetical protein